MLQKDQWKNCMGLNVFLGLRNAKYSQSEIQYLQDFQPRLIASLLIIAAGVGTTALILEEAWFLFSRQKTECEITRVVLLLE